MIDVTFEDYMDAAAILRKYAMAVQNRLYMDMKVSEAHDAIAEALRLADILEAAATKVDTVPPSVQK